MDRQNRGMLFHNGIKKQKVKKRLATQKSLSVRMLLIKLENCIKLVRNENTCSW